MMHPTDQWATANGFGPRKNYTPEALSMPASRRGPKRLKGLYLVEFENGACYIGISKTDCARRLVAHGKTYDDVIGFRVQRFTGSYSALRDRERSLIHDAERSGLVVRNREHALRFEGESTLDSLVISDEQELWLEEPADTLLDDAASDPPTLPSSQIEGYRHRWARFSARPDAVELAEIVGSYLRSSVCYPRRTEAQFWSVSCLPTSNPDRLACVTLNWMETFVLFTDSSGQVCASLFVDGEELPHGKLRRAVYLRRLGVKRGWIKHAPGGPSQQHLIARGHKKIKDLIADPVIVRAAASLNIALMRKGRGSQTKTHCFQLARAAFGQTAHV